MNAINHYFSDMLQGKNVAWIFQQFPEELESANCLQYARLGKQANMDIASRWNQRAFYIIRMRAKPQKTFNTSQENLEQI